MAQALVELKLVHVGHGEARSIGSTIGRLPSPMYAAKVAAIAQAERDLKLGEFLILVAEFGGVAEQPEPETSPVPTG